MVHFDVNDSHTNVLRSVKPISGSNHDQLRGWYNNDCFTLSISSPGDFHLLEGASQVQHHDVGDGDYTARDSSSARPRVTQPS